MRHLGRRSRRLGATAVGLLTLMAIAHREASAAPGPSVVVHEVMPGDTLGALARRYGVTVPALTAANRMPRGRTTITVGRTLRIPPRKTVSPAKPTKPPAKVVAPTVTLARTERALRPPRVARPPQRLRGRQVTDGLLPPPMSLVLGVPEFVIGAPPFAWPVDGGVSSAYGRRRRGWHRGIDIQAEAGAPVHASAPGLVVASGVEPRYGLVVKLEHEGGFLTVYAHNSGNVVTIGDWVVSGQLIASVGRTGRATRPHLHFEIRQDGRVFNPLYLLPLPPQVGAAEPMESDEDDDE